MRGGKQSRLFKLIPKFIRKPIQDNRTKNIILEYYNGISKTELLDEEIEALNYLKENKLSVFPYPFQKDYSKESITVLKDDKLKLKYVLIDGKRLYFKRTSSTRGIKRNYNYLKIEQDLNSPHRYLTDKFAIREEDILVDVGAAEGNLALSVIEKVKKVYLFETDKKWIEALEATFAPWKDKVEIINKFVSNKNDEHNVSLSQFFKDKEMFSFLKIDAEGSDAEVLEGGEELLLAKSNLKIALCCYHRPLDGKKFSAYLNEKGFTTSFSKGLMIYDEPKTFSPPYLRKGVLRAVKKG